VVFTRVGSVKGSPTNEGDNGYLKVRSVLFNEKLALLYSEDSTVGAASDVDIG